MKSKKGTTIQTCAGALLIVLGAYCSHYAWRAARAHWIYKSAKYGPTQDDLSVALRSIERAHRLYPHNYRFCIWAAEQAYTRRSEVGGTERQRRYRAAENWTDVGLALNPFSGPLQLVKARLLQKRDPAAAATGWAKYVEWHFWEPYNHAVLVDLYASAGDFTRAANALDWVKGSEHYEWAMGRLQDAWRAEMTLPPQD
ncbi:MAG: hypothetical protein QGH42_13780 [Kiritimatiellia bacterium]|jgi:hypothetical protein|nr:hypothetical protein [Kiritimatiellia bacterium]MDP6630880.1 hypothetical protein [Kiritimatiellia bacterium]MDP6811148.1 hypothetical protein [Kiritimatiellia bacterium]MDP7025295.1 hypothetical protein [Kiritimatiellia bacterium]